MSYDVDAPALSFFRNVTAQLFGTVLDRPTRRNRGNDDFDTLSGQGRMNAVPVLDCRQVRACQLQLGKAEQAMS